MSFPSANEMRTETNNAIIKELEWLKKLITKAAENGECRVDIKKDQITPQQRLYLNGKGYTINIIGYKYSIIW